MSMISSQSDKLRELAIRANELHEYEMERGLDQAADLILELRDGLQQANDENAKLIVKLNAEHIARQNVEIEYAKLREDFEFANNEWEKESLEYLNLQAENAELRTQLADVTESMGRVEKRCARLRELCRDMFTTISWCNLDCYPSDNKKLEYADRMRWLGADVDDSV